MQTCKYCIFASEVDESTALEIRISGAVLCKRFPPVLTHIPTQQGIMNVQGYPTMKPDGWCGEYKPKGTGLN